MKFLNNWKEYTVMHCRLSIGHPISPVHIQVGLVTQATANIAGRIRHTSPWRAASTTSKYTLSRTIRFVPPVFVLTPFLLLCPSSPSPASWHMLVVCRLRASQATCNHRYTRVQISNVSPHLLTARSYFVVTSAQLSRRRTLHQQSH
jgi:TRAP-type uncharacterized transport system fused permease subunit